MAVALGAGSHVKAGPNGVIAAYWYDEKAKRPRLLVGYVGVRGVKAGVYYRAVSGKWKEVR
jgi:hypothetical protein